MAMGTLVIRGDGMEMHEESHKTAAKACRRLPFYFVMELAVGSLAEVATTATGSNPCRRPSF